jgi:transcriptional regulator with XRE-family HTH domain
LNKRIKLIRDSENLTQDEFGKRIGSARNTIANYETGNRTPSNAVIISICKEFNVNETWLRTGEGEMFCPTDRFTEIAKLTRELLTEESDSFKNRLISALSRLNEEQWEVLEALAESLQKKE